MKKKIIGQSKSSRLNPNISVQNESSSGEHSECENDMDKTIIDASCEQKAMEEFKKQLDEMRLQLQTALACVATEKQEKLRLQEILAAQQISVVVSTSGVTSPYTTAPAASSAHLASATNLVTATSAGNMCTEFVLPQSLPTQWSGMVYTQSQPTVSAHPLVGDTGTLLTSRKVPQMPSFLPPLFDSQQFCSNQIEASPTVRAMPTMSSTSASVQNNLYSSQALAFRKLYDLPEFTGKPEDWPLFCTTFRDSTAMYGYTDVDNLLRLQKALKGSAREVVEAMLIHPSSINQAMAALEFRFGRPDILLRSQLLKLREISPISEDSLELLIPFATKVQNLVTFIEASGITSQLANPTILDELVGKLPMSKKLEWVQRSICGQPFPTIRQFEEWLTGSARLICLVTPIHPQSQPKPGSKPNPRNVLYAVEQKPGTVKPIPNCRLCNKSKHLLSECPLYNRHDSASKWNLVKKQKLCFCCLKYGHSVRFCKMKKVCGKQGCTKNHHPSLHEVTEAPVISTFKTNATPVFGESILNCNKEKNNKILFRVLPVRLYGDGTVIRTFALLDEGSSVTIMSTSLAKTLCLKGRRTDLKLQWFGQESFTNESFVVDLHISADLHGAEKYKMEAAHTVDNLCLPTQTLTKADLSNQDEAIDILSRFPAMEYSDVSPQILIGLDNCHLGAPIRIIGSSKIGPIITETKLGFVVYGGTATVAKNSSTLLILHGDQNSQEEEITRMFEEYLCIDNFGVKKPKDNLISAVDKKALEILSNTTKKINNRYQTGLLWKQSQITLSPSYDMALRRLVSLENKFKREPEFAEKYRSIIKSYLQKGYARELTQDEAKLNTPRTWYLPHFGVRNPNKPDKIRLVFDAAAKVNGVSLNSFLLKGPDDLKPLLKILYNFRMRRVAVTGDIREMFHQVLIQPEDQNSQRFLWRESEDKQIGVYIMQSMTFGATCSPCSANYVKNTNARRFIEAYPKAVAAIIDHHYVDDYVESFEDVEEAITVTNAVVAIHESGGFELRNFISNEGKVLRNINYANMKKPQQSRIVTMNIKATVEKVLGMFWDPGEDVFIFTLNFSRISKDIIEGQRRPTKRELLSVTMSVFDPFGMIANFVIYAKLLLQSLWKSGTEWDQPIPDDVFQKWNQWRKELRNVSDLKVPRCYHVSLSTASRIVLHTFVDASEEAFSAVVYMRIEHENQVSVKFICGKTRCAPKRLISIPRLELSAAVLGVRLCDSVLECHDLMPIDRIFWSDSKTVLNWLRSDPRQHKQFVGFRIAEILDSSKICQWRWVSSKMNSADEATRACYPPVFRVNNKWIDGAPFLKMPENQWPLQPDDIPSYICQDEIRSKFILFAKVSTPIFDFDRFSSYLKLKRTAAWLIRFVKSCRNRITTEGELSPSELEEAERMLCVMVQRDVFAQEICQLSSNQPIEKSSSIYKLTPYMDADQLLRVYGRIDAATTLPFSCKRPVILPKDHKLTNLIVSHFHRRLRHQNDDTVANEIRQHFWIPSLRTAIQKERRRCLFCKIRSAHPLPPLMGQLPKDRLTPFMRPFSYTGLDYFGPVNVTVGRHKEKRWIALFTCLTVRAIHLEVAADLSTDACILCIRNFVNRRGVPVRIRSDNGTNFIGAKNELLTSDVFDNDTIKSELSAKGIEWIFNSPSNPHAGGCWERLIRSVKRVLSVTLSSLAPKPDTLVSALIEAENIVNSRPLTHLPVSTEDAEPLTPNHFLIGGMNSTQTPGVVNERSLCLRKQWRISQQIKDRFWRRWIKEYLPELTKRSKWFVKVPNIQVGNLVLVCDDNVPRSHWVRGRVLKVFVGPDEQVRSAEIKTSSGVIMRPAVKLAVLEICGETPVEPGASRGVGC